MKKITAIITVDDCMGLAFNNRRQSRDKNLIDDVMRNINGTIYVSEYSVPLFESYKERIKVVKNPLAECENGECCFLELTDVSVYINLVERLIVYRWNRHYPSDKKLTVDLNGSSFTLNSSYDFAGSSHEVITKEIYKTEG